MPKLMFFCYPLITLSILTSVGCENQQTKHALILAQQENLEAKEALEAEKAIRKELEEQLAVVQEAAKGGILERAARELAEKAGAEAGKLRATAEEALTNAKAEAEIISANMKSQIATAQAEAEQLVANAEAKLAAIGQELAAAKIRITELEAEIKQPVKEEEAE